MANLNAIAALIDSELAARGDALWGESISLGLWLNPIAHRLLDRPTGTARSVRSSVISEALRLGALLWIIWIKRKHHAYPGSPAATAQKLFGFLMQLDWMDVLNDTDVLSIQLWSLVLCGISYDGPAPSTSPVHMIALRMRQMGWNDWSEVMMHVCQMPWTHAFDVTSAHLAERVQRINQEQICAGTE